MVDLGVQIVRLAEIHLPPSRMRALIVDAGVGIRQQTVRCECSRADGKICGCRTKISGSGARCQRRPASVGQAREVAHTFAQRAHLGISIGENTLASYVGDTAPTAVPAVVFVIVIRDSIVIVVGNDAVGGGVVVQSRLRRLLGLRVEIEGDVGGLLVSPRLLAQ
jgi:hypothetical protein